MDKDIQKGLADRLYDKRKLAALELEQTIRQCLQNGDHDKIRAIIDDLCRNFAYAVHHPNSRNGGLIGLAAAAIALGQHDVAPYLEDIVHPVLACFGDQDSRVRYYACESMYNIAKVAKGEILVYFNEVFDALCKLSTDSELSVTNGADLLDRLMKDIVAEKAATYVSVIIKSPPPIPTPTLYLEERDPSKPTLLNEEPQSETTFSLAKFIPLLMERIYVFHPFARMFLVSWITLLDSIPDLELISYLPSFLGGLITFLSDPNEDVRVATRSALDGFLQEIRRITHIKQTVALQRQGRLRRQKSANLIDAADSKALPAPEPASLEDDTKTEGQPSVEPQADEPAVDGQPESDVAVTEGGAEKTDDDAEEEDEDDDGQYIPGQDIYINFDKVIEILISHLGSSEEDIQVMVLLWIETILEVSPYSMLPYGPRFLSVLLPTMSCDGQTLRHAAERVNEKMQQLMLDLPAEIDNTDPDVGKLDYSATVNALTLHFLNEKEDTRVAALDWLLMLQRNLPRKLLAINDGTFPALLKTLSDPSELVITKDLQLLAQISYNSDDEYFTVFMVNLLNLFSTDRRLLETRGKLIIRQLCMSLSPERIYRTMADILERDDDVEFASMMVLNLNNNLITAPELSDLRTRLRSLDTRDGASFFVTLFKSWCHNSAAALSLCLLAQAYEHAFQVLQILAEFEITVELLVQIDKLVQLLESPVFTQLRLQLLEPEKYPFLYKCLYGILMILPQSSAFNTLRNRLNSVSAIGYVHIPQPRAASVAATAAKSGKHNYRDDIKWTELLDKFRSAQRRLHATRNMAQARASMKSSFPSAAAFKSPGQESAKGFRKERADSQDMTATNFSDSTTSLTNGTVTGLGTKNTGLPGKESGIRRFTSRGPFGLRKSEENKRK